MRKVLHFSSPHELYTCDAVVIWCFDARFETGFRKLLKRIGVVQADSIRIAGGAKSLVSPKYESNRLFLIDQLRIAMQLHGAKRVVLMVHSDCGAYGGLPAFDNDPKKEAEHHNTELQKAAAYIKSVIPELSVEAYFIDFEGVWQIELAGEQLSPDVAVMPTRMKMA